MIHHRLLTRAPTNTMDTGHVSEQMCDPPPAGSTGTHEHFRHRPRQRGEDPPRLRTHGCHQSTDRMRVVGSRTTAMRLTYVGHQDSRETVRRRDQLHATSSIIVTVMRVERTDWIWLESTIGTIVMKRIGYDNSFS